MAAVNEEEIHPPFEAFVEGKEDDSSHQVTVQNTKKGRKKFLALVAIIVIILLVAAITIPLALLLDNDSNTEFGITTNGETSSVKSNSTTLKTTSSSDIPTTEPLSGKWSSWTACSVSCGNGTKQRSRVCPQNSTCNSSVDSIPCVMSSCYEPASWGHWSQWSQCSVTCAEGVQVRNRTCVGIDVTKCEGSDHDRRNCTGPSCPRRDCLDWFISGESRDGIYSIDPNKQGPFQVYCDMTTDGGGWTVFQRRQDGSENFYRTWDEYKTGFGNLSGEFWLGNGKIHRLTARTLTRLSVDLLDWTGGLKNATYGKFRVENETLNYTLTVESYAGNAGDSFSRHNRMKFTTKDRDNDKEGASNCAVAYHGGWWFNACVFSNLNGKYVGNTSNRQGIIWLAISTHVFNSLKYTQMRIRRQT